jgi:hypothetical protein
MAEESSIELGHKDLVALLKATQRMANINGKMIPQVKGTILKIHNDEVRTFSIVRDGASSISSFCADISPNHNGEYIPISDIGLVLGALTKHKGLVTLEHDGEDKLRIISSGKRTTLTSSDQTPAFAHSKQTLEEWANDSQTRYSHTIEQNYEKYTLKDGSTCDPLDIIEIKTQDLLSAMDSGNMNSQKVDKYTFANDNKTITLKVGELSKGTTTTHLEMLSADSKFESCTVSGGLENVLRNYTGENVKIAFFDLSPYGGGVSLLLSCAGFGCVFQREVV